MKKLITLFAALTLSTSAMAGMENPALIKHADDIKSIIHGICMDKYNKEICGKLDERIDVLLDMVSREGRQQVIDEMGK